MQNWCLEVGVEVGVKNTCQPDAVLASQKRADLFQNFEHFGTVFIFVRKSVIAELIVFRRKSDLRNKLDDKIRETLRARQHDLAAEIFSNDAGQQKIGARDPEAARVLGFFVLQH